MYRGDRTAVAEIEGVDPVGEPFVAKRLHDHRARREIPQVVVPDAADESADQGSAIDTAGAGVDLAGDDLVPGVDVGRARHARIEAPQGPQDVDRLVVLGLVELLEDGRVP